VLPQAGDSLAHWSSAAVHDTVSAIVRQTIFQQRLGRSFAERFWAWFWEQIAALFNTVAGTPTARTITLFAAGLLVAALLVRFAYSTRFERRLSHDGSRGRDFSAFSLPTLDEARRLAREARYAEAMHVLYAALLDALAQRRLIRLHASKTSGDFSRELFARGHPAHVPFRSFARRFDRLFYGYDRCDAASFDALWNEAERVLRSAAQSGAA
jgi:hypothetical protein